MPPGRSSTETPLTRSRTSAESLSTRSTRSRLARRLERLLGLGRGELRLGLLLFAYLFLVIAACSMGGSMANSLFLSKFRAVQLPLADLASVAAVMALMAGYMRLARAVPLRNLLVGSLLGFAALNLLFWWLVSSAPTDGLMPVVFVWVGIAGALAPMQVWTLANHVLTLRQAKRLLPVIGSGSILGGICGGAVTKAVTRARGTETLLLVIAVVFVACAALMPFICRRPRTALGADAPRPTVPKKSALGVAASTVWHSPYLRLIAAIACLASFIASMTKWQFLAIAHASLPKTDEFTEFQGLFNMAMNAVALTVQLALAAPILRRVGIGGALSIVPAALAAGSAGLLVFGSLGAVVLLRGSDLVLRYSVDRSARELLFLPLARAEAAQVKSFTDTIVSRFGDALACGAILAFSGARWFSPSQLAWLTIALVAVWLTVARTIHHEYLGTLSDALRQNRVDVQGVTVLDRATTELLASNLGRRESKRVLSALSVVEASRAPGVLPKVEQLIAHSSAAVRARALAVLSVSRPGNPPAGIDALLFDPDLRVRSAALVYMSRAGLDPLARLQKAGDFEDLSVRSSLVVYLARPGPTQNLEACRELLDAMIRERGPEGRKARLEAARLLASLPNAFKEQFPPLLADEDGDVVRHAIRAVGRVRGSRFVPRLIEALADAELATDAAGALARFGHRIVPVLAASLADVSVDGRIRREIPKVLLRIASPSAEQALIDNLAALDPVVRFQVASSLNLLKRRHPEPPVDRAPLEKALVAEIADHYRPYLSSPRGAVQADASAPAAQPFECIFRLLQLLMPGRDISSVQVGVQSADAVVRDKALEFLDNILAPHLRAMLVPLIDSKVEAEERAAIAARVCANV
jgi:AAA family ATP:ADP antiporter